MQRTHRCHSLVLRIMINVRMIDVIMKMIMGHSERMLTVKIL